MGSYTFGVDTELDAPIQQVWEYLTTHDEWRQPFVESVRQVTDGEMEVGSRYENRARMGPVTMTLVNEITELDPPRRLGWRQVTDGPMVTEAGSYTLEPLDGDRTRFTLSVRGSTRGVMRPLGRLVPVMARRMMAPRLLGQLRDGVASSD